MNAKSDDTGVRCPFCEGQGSVSIAVAAAIEAELAKLGRRAALAFWFREVMVAIVLLGSLILAAFALGCCIYA